MKILRDLLRKIFYCLKGPNLSDKEIAERIILAIRSRGGIVGENVDIIASSIDMGEPYLLKIGNNVTLTGVKILTHDASIKKKLGYSKVGKVHIGDNVFVGWGSIILPNTTIGNRVVIGAGTVVSKDIPDDSVVVGNPCRVICSFSEYIEKNKELMKEYPIIDLLPEELLLDEENKAKLIEKGFGYIR